MKSRLERQRLQQMLDPDRSTPTSSGRSDADDDDDDEDDEDDDEDEVLVVDLEGKRAALMEGTSSMRRSVSVKC